MAPGKYTFMQSNLIDVKMCSFLQKHCIFEIKASRSRLTDRHLFRGLLPPQGFLLPVRVGLVSIGASSR